MNSYIISYIRNNLGEEVSVQEVKELMNDIDIKCKTKDNRIIFNYTIGANFSDPVVQEARGIIMDMGAEDVSQLSQWRVVCYPFRKFGNYGESYADNIDWNTAQVQAKIDGCFTRRDNVLLADGTTKSIADIVNNKEQVEVLSYNFDKEKIEPKKVIGWKKGELTTPDLFLTIHTEKIKNSIEGKISQHHIITPTKNHVFFIKENNKIIERSADELKPGDILLTPTKGLTEIEKQVILGGWLGDGSIVNKNSGSQGFCAIHSQKQKEYVDFKASLFSSIPVKRKDYTTENAYGKQKSSMTTGCTQGFTNLYNLCYKDGQKKVSKQWLEKLDWLGFAIWYMDDGSLQTGCKNNSIHLHTEGFSIEENNIIAKFFNENGFLTYVQSYRNYNIINFSTTASEQIWREIRQYIIPSMQYKLPKRHQGFFDSSIYDFAEQQLSQIELTTGVITKIEDGLHRAEIPGKTPKYDIEVEDNHNYFCNGILVHNSILKLYRYEGQWRWATNGCIEACDANAPMFNRTFQDVLELADNFNNINYDNLDKNKTYIFELVSPETRVVVEYDKTHLYHLGTRSNVTGLEFNDNIGIEKPRIYNITDPNLEKVVEKANHLNNGVCKHEGFVVCDANYNRIKVKNPAYLMLHHSLTKNSISKEDVVEAIIFNDEEKILAILSYPHLKVQFKYYDWQVTKFLYELDLYITYARNLYSSLGSRKDFALKIKDDNFKAFGFMAIDNVNLDAVQMVKKVGIKRILRFIED